MLQNQPKQGIQFGKVSQPTKIMLQTDIDSLFSAQAKLPACIRTCQNLFEINFSQENKARIDASAWLELQKELLNIEKELFTALKQAQYLLTNCSINTVIEDSNSVNNWATNSKRAILLDLLNDSDTDLSIIESIDTALLEDETIIDSFTKPALRNDLLALLEEQVKDFSKLAKDFELAVTSEQQEEMLSKLLGDSVQQEDILFDVFASGLTNITDFEVSFTVIATYLVLCS